MSHDARSMHAADEVANLQRRLAELEAHCRTLAGQHARMRAVVEGNDDALWDWPDLNDEHVWWSPRFFELLGYEANAFEPTLSRFRDMLHPDDREERMQAMDEMVQSGKAFEAEYRLRTKSGDYRWFRARGKTQLDASGNPVRMAGSVRDITDQKEAQAALQESERRLATLMSNLPGMAYRCLADEQWTMIFVSDGAKELTGYASTDLVGNNRVAYGEIIHPEDRPFVEVTTQQALSQGRQFELVYRIVTATGDERWVWERGRRVSAAGEEPAVLEGFIEDITDRRQGEEAVRRGEQYFRALFEQSPQAIGVARVDGTILMTNRAVIDMLGYDEQTLVGSNVLHLYADPQQREHVLQSFGAHGSVREREVRLRRADGGVITVSLTMVPFQWRGEDAILSTMIDITERTQAQEALRASEDMFSKTFHRAPAPLALSTLAEGRFLEVNDAFVRGLGRPREDIVGVTSRQLGMFSSEARQRMAETVAKNGSVAGLVLEYTRPDGEQVIFSYAGELVEMAGEKRVLSIMSDITEQRRAESRLRESERALWSTLDGLPYSVALLDSEGRILIVNRAWRDFAESNGAAAADVATGTNYLHACDRATGPDADLAQRFAAGIRAVLAGETRHFRLEYPCHSPQEQRWFVGHVTPYAGDDRSRVVVSHENITERVLAEQAVQEASLRQQQAVQAGNVGLWDWDVRTNRVDYSPEWKAQLGYEEHEIADHFEEWRRRVHPDDLEPTLAQLEEALQGDASTSQTEFRLQHKDGSYRWILARASILRDADGEPIRALGSHVDLTERRLAEQALAESEQRLRTLINAMPDIVCFKDGAGRWLEANDFDLNLFELAGIDYRGKTDAELAEFSPFYREALLACEASDEAAWRAGEITRGEEIIPRPDGSQRVFDIIKVPTFQPDGTRRGLLVVGRDITERKEAEELRRRTEERLELALESANIGAWDHDLVNGTVLRDERTARMLGYEPAELAQSLEDWKDLMHPDDLPRFEQAGRAHEAGETAHFRVEHRLRHKSGDWRWILNTGRIVERDAEGKPLRALGIHIDITEQKEAERRLRESREIMTSIFRVAPIGIGVVRDRVFLDVNDRFCQLVGYELTELIGHSSRRIYANEEEYERVGRVKYRQIQQHGIGTVETRFRRKDGASRDILLSSTPLDADAHEPSVIFTALDITDRKEALAALRDSEEKLRYIVEHATNMFYSHTPDHHLTYVSPQSRHLLGCEPEEAMTRWTEFLTDHPVNRQAVEITQRAVRTGQPQEPYECQVRTRDGRTVWLEVHEAPVVENGRTVAIVGALTDITDRRQAWEQLQQQAELERMLRRELDHRVRNNLTSLIALIDLAARSARDPEQLAASMRSRVHAMATVHSLLSDEHWQPIDFRSILQRTLIAEDSHMVTLEGPEVLVAPERVQPLVMVVNELATNSRKHGALSKPHGRLHVSWRTAQAERSPQPPTLLEVTWREQDGPQIPLEVAPGVGLQLVKGLIGTELDGEFELNFPSDGARHTLWINVAP